MIKIDLNAQESHPKKATAVEKNPESKRITKNKLGFRRGCIPADAGLAGTPAVNPRLEKTA